MPFFCFIGVAIRIKRINEGFKLFKFRINHNVYILLLLFMIRLILKNFKRAVYLFKKNDSCHLMGES